jgi:7,8-dihydroneopterin aldolase/epimerase/oxygenase
MGSLDKIILSNMKFYGYHGVMPQEQENGQNFFIDVEMFTDIEKPGLSDNLEDTIDYSEVYGVIKNITTNEKFRLIEKLADNISREILLRFEKIDKIIVRVRKPDAPIDGEFDWAGVQVERDRNDL